MCDDRFQAVSHCTLGIGPSGGGQHLPTAKRQAGIAAFAGRCEEEVFEGRCQDRRRPKSIGRTDWSMASDDKGFMVLGAHCLETSILNVRVPLGLNHCRSAKAKRSVHREGVTGQLHCRRIETYCEINIMVDVCRKDACS